MNIFPRIFVSIDNITQHTSTYESVYQLATQVSDSELVLFYAYELDDSGEVHSNVDFYMYLGYTFGESETTGYELHKDNDVLYDEIESIEECIRIIEERVQA